MGTIKFKDNVWESDLLSEKQLLNDKWIAYYMSLLGATDQGLQFSSDIVSDEKKAELARVYEQTIEHISQRVRELEKFEHLKNNQPMLKEGLMHLYRTDTKGVNGSPSQTYYSFVYESEDYFRGFITADSVITHRETMICKIPDNVTITASADGDLYRCHNNITGDYLQLFADVDTLQPVLDRSYTTYQKGGDGRIYLSPVEILDSQDFHIEETKKNYSDTSQKAIEMFGVTNDVREAGYILVDGQYLDLSEKNDGGEPRQRNADHRDIGQCYGSISGTDALIQFQGEGNIRICPESGGIDIVVPPTVEQRKTIRDFVNYFKGEVIVDISSASGKVMRTLEYNKGTSSTRVLDDIKQGFHELGNGTEKDLSNRQEQSLGLAQLKSEPRLFVDMDGTLARFHDEVKYLERMFEKGFFANLQPFDEAVEGIRKFISENPEVEVFILSGAVDGEPPYCQAEKHQWLDRHLPEIDHDHRIFTTVGKNKSLFVPNGITKGDFLWDDYNVSLEQWQQDGGNAIKCHNNINHRGKVGKLWEGAIISNQIPSEVISKELTVGIHEGADKITRMTREQLLSYAETTEEQYHTICKLLNKGLSAYQVGHLLDVPGERILEAKEWEENHHVEIEADETLQEEAEGFMLSR